MHKNRHALAAIDQERKLIQPPLYKNRLALAAMGLMQPHVVPNRCCSILLSR
jgi:hypothetical protein